MVTEHSIRVGVGDGYDVRIGAGVLGGVGEVVASLTTARSAMLVIDSGVPDELRDVVGDSLASAGVRVHRFEITPSERDKSIVTLQRLLEELAQTELERKDVVVALGGGIVGDVAGFAAASYRRGMPVLQCPTTLLSMVDASVGGKTGVNLSVAGNLRKNFVGAFWQPIGVIADVVALRSLTGRTLRAGLAECVKHCLIHRAVGASLGEEPLDWLLRHAGAVLHADEGACTELVAWNVQTKAAAVEADERELASAAQGGRMLLNLGHTFAHVIEPIERLSSTGDPDDAPLMHGEAVSLGLAACTAASVELGMMTGEARNQVLAVLERLGLPTSVRGLPNDSELIDAMRQDKKTSSGAIRVVVPSSDGRVLGTACVIESPDEGVLRAGWSGIRC